MIELTASEIARATGGTLTATVDPLVTVTSATTDSREILVGGLFLAKPGEQADGHDFIPAARKAGAPLILAERETYDADGVADPAVLVPDTVDAMGRLAREIVARIRAHSPTTVIGITGSVGKTTTKDALATVLRGLAPEAKQDPLAVISPKGSYNGEVGVPLTIFTASLETRYLVIEMGADQVGNIAQLCQIVRPDIAVVLAVGSAHAASFGSVENIVATKGELVEALEPGGVAILNADDVRVASMAERVPAGADIFWISTASGTHSHRALTAAHFTTDDAERPMFELSDSHQPQATYPVTSGLVGGHHATNLLAAAAAAQAAGFELDDIARQLNGLGPSSAHRMARTDRADGITIIDDSYNANPESTRAALKTLALMGRNTGRRTWAVLGEMLELGDRHSIEHILIGETVVRLNISQLVVVGAGARALYTGAVMEGSWGDEVDHVLSLEEAEDLLAQRLQPGDIVLVKGSNSTRLWALADKLTNQPDLPLSNSLKTAEGREIP